MKKPTVVIILLILSILTIISSFVRIMDLERRSLSMELLGPVLGNFDYAMDILLLLFSLVLIYGYLKAKKWTLKGTVYFYGIYIIGQLIGLIISFFYSKEIIDIASISRYGEIRPYSFSQQSVFWIGLISIVLQCVIIYFILRWLYNNKRYFRY